MRFPIKNHGHWVGLVCISDMYMSGYGGLLHWPPTTFKSYATIIDWTGIPGPEGAVIRISLALFALIGWLLPLVWLRQLGYFAVGMCALMLAAGFWDVGQGFASFSWINTLCWSALALLVRAK